MDTQFKSQRRLVFTTSLVALAMFSGIAPSFARGWGQEHPRRSEVLGRDNNINNRINSDRGNLGGHYGQLKGEDRSIRAQEQADARANGGYITRGEQHQLNREENHVNNQIRRDYNPNQQLGGGYQHGGYPGGGVGYTGGGYPGSVGYPVGGYPGGGYPGGGGFPVTGVPSYPGGVPGGNFAENHPRRAEVLHRDNALNREVQADKGDLSGHYGQLRQEDSAIRHQEQADARANGGYITHGEQAQLNHEENHVQNQINRDVR